MVLTQEHSGETPQAASLSCAESQSAPRSFLTQGDEQVPAGGAQDPTPDVQSQESLPEGAATCVVPP